MLPPANRLRKEKDIKRVLSQRTGFRSGLLICKTADNGLDTARFCFMVSKRISNKAVVRNRLKRRLREAVAENLFRVRGGKDCILIASPGLEKKVFSDLSVLVGKVLTGSRIIGSVSVAPGIITNQK
ncbi:MAG: ribonuclease P protein component [Candidatus Pacebacteria bacterium]|jgi:ribonuclease P protein component|nr:ribonuclease P protein component [Candidatus Paceibacterota bacterium]